MGLKLEDTNKYLTVLSDGKIRMTVPEGHEGAVKREYETSKGEKGSKWELVIREVSGTISHMGMRKTDYGKVLNISIGDADEVYILSLNTASPFGEDFMKKLPNIDLSKEVVIAPYSFEDDRGKSRKGLSIYQDDKKVENYYYDSEKKESLNGLPAPEGDVKEYDSDDWKAYYLSVRKFLVKEVEKAIKKYETIPF